MIADAERAVALAGIMGGEETEIGDGTTEVLLEAANFEPTGIFRTSERLRLRTEGSNRWEKGVDPYLAEPAAELATRADRRDRRRDAGSGDADVQGELPERPVIRFRPERADELIGLETPPAEQHALARAARLREPRRRRRRARPGARRDVTREVDVVEEVARFRLDDVPFTLPARREMFGALTPMQRLRRRVEDVLAGLGLAETYTPSLRPDDADPQALRLPEPISAELAVLRTQPAAEPRRGRAAQRRARRRRRRAVRGRARLPARRRACPTSRRTSPAIVEGGWSRAKGIVEALYAALKAEPSFERAERRAAPSRARRRRPRPVSSASCTRRVLEGVWGAFELDLAKLLEVAREEVRYKDVITFPPVHQDLAFAVAEDVERRRARRRRARGRGPGAARDARRSTSTAASRSGEGRKSIAFAATFQSAERTLTDEDAATLRERIVSALSQRFGAELRA